MKTKGFTLIELTIVVVIVGLMTQMLLMGQSAIHNARVHDIITQQDGVRAAFMGFADRYRALPGDYAAASTSLACVPACGNGNDNGRIDSAEATLAWTHLSAAGYISGNYRMAGPTDTAPNDANTPRNVYGAFITLGFDSAYGNGSQAAHHNIKTGGMVPADILWEADVKMDDGLPYSGEFQADSAACVNTAQWSLLLNDCGAVTVLK